MENMKKERKKGTYCIQCLEDKKVIIETKEKCIINGWGSCIRFKRHRYKPYTKEELRMKPKDITIRI